MSDKKEAVANATKVEDLSFVAQILAKYLDEKASGHAKRYFVDASTFVDYLANVVDTMEAIRSTVSSTITTEDGDSFAVEEYQIPDKLHDYVNGGIIYATADAVSCKEPIFKVPRVRAKLAPSKFNGFWNKYNSYQRDDNDKVKVSAFKRETCTLEANVQYAKDGDELVKLHEGGYSIETCNLIGYPLKSGLKEYLTTYPCPSRDYYVKWLSNSTTE